MSALLSDLRYGVRDPSVSECMPYRSSRRTPPGEPRISLCKARRYAPLGDLTQAMSRKSHPFALQFLNFDMEAHKSDDRHDYITQPSKHSQTWALLQPLNYCCSVLLTSLRLKPSLTPLLEHITTRTTPAATAGASSTHCTPPLPLPGAARRRPRRSRALFYTRSKLLIPLQPPAGRQRPRVVVVPFTLTAPAAPHAQRIPVLP